MTDRRAIRVEAGEAAHRLDSRKLGQADGHRRIFLVRDVLGDLDRLIAARRFKLLEDAVDVVDAELEKLGERG
jgi:hypothetical protein